MIIRVGSQIPFEETQYDVLAIEERRISRRAERTSDEFERELRGRPHTRFVALAIEPHERGDVIEESYMLLRLQSAMGRSCNVFTKYEVRRKGVNRQNPITRSAEAQAARQGAEGRPGLR